MIYVISSNKKIVDQIKTALETDVAIHANDTQAFLAAVLRAQHTGEACVIVDLSTIPDAERIITFTKASSKIGRLPIVAMGTQEEHDALPPDVACYINGVIVAPYSAGELATVVASVCEQRLPEIGRPEPQDEKPAP